MDKQNTLKVKRIASLYRDLLSNKFHAISENEKDILLSIKPKNKIVAIGDIDTFNWNAYPLTYLLDKKLIAPTVLDESKIYQSIQAMRTNNKSIMHPQLLISESVIIRIVGLDNSTNINDYINTFISMCIASDRCKIIFVIIDSDKRFYKNNVYTRKSNSSFIDYNSPDLSPVKIESSKLCINPDDITFFNYSKKCKNNTQVKTAVADNTSKINKCSSMLQDPNYF